MSKQGDILKVEQAIKQEIAEMTEKLTQLESRLDDLSK